MSATACTGQHVFAQFKGADSCFWFFRVFFFWHSHAEKLKYPFWGEDPDPAVSLVAFSNQPKLVSICLPCWHMCLALAFVANP